MDFKDRYFSQWGEAWNFHKRWCNNFGSEMEWDAIVEEAKQLMNKSEFSKALILSVLDELERSEKKRRKDGEVNE